MAASPDTPYYAAVAALNQYEHRLLHALRFIEETANARLAVPPSDIENQLNTLVEYVFAGEQEYTSAAEQLQLREKDVARLTELRAQSAAVRDAIYSRLSLLQAEAQQVEEEMRSLRHLIARFESDPPLPASPYDAAQALAAHVSQAGADSIPVGWRLGDPLPGQAQAQAQGQGPLLAEEEDRGVAGGQGDASGDVAMSDEPAALVAHPAQPVQAVADTPQAQAQQASAPASPRPLPSTATAAPQAAAPPFLSMVATLPPQARAKLLSLLPPGWTPGQPLPPSLLAQDPRQLLAQLLGKPG